MNRQRRSFSTCILNAGIIAAGCAVATTSLGEGMRPVTPAPPAVVALPRLVSVTRGKEVFRDHEQLVFYGLRSTGGTCAALTVDIDGVEETRTNVSFPLTLGVFARDRLYPRGDGVHTLTLRGHRGDCRGVVQTTFHTRTTPKPPHLPVTGALASNGHGVVTAFQVSGFDSPTAKGALIIRGNGVCRMHADIMDLGQPSPATNPPVRKVFDPGASLPVELDDLGPLPSGSYRAYLIGYDDVKCPVQGPNKAAGGWYVDFKVGAGASPSNNPPSHPNGQGGNGGGAPPPGGSSIPPAPKPAVGQIASMLVPDGSFAEDDPQKLQVNGQGGCAMSLAISNKSYGGSFDQAYPVNPVKLDGGATLYNGTHFGTLAEGSYHAQATGTGGCTGSAGIDFKVTPKVSTKKVLGKPTISFDQQPKSGSAFSAADSNIWFKVTVPQSIKDEPYASCCDIELDYKNEYGGWEPLPNSPFNDSSYVLAITQQAGVVPRSVSYFSNGTQWRIKVRGYKFQTEFEWSDWVEFQVNQH